MVLIRAYPTSQPVPKHGIHSGDRGTHQAVLKTFALFRIFVTAIERAMLIRHDPGNLASVLIGLLNKLYSVSKGVVLRLGHSSASYIE